MPNVQCPMPDDARCFKSAEPTADASQMRRRFANKPGNPSNALPPQRTGSPMPNAR
ncbi:MAG: hypothetical protein KME22_31845 [Hassallia sp. WJT32-NPBG1]|nr:hypothetical protein [Hassallia sp. WJT32-NPBG1]